MTDWWCADCKEYDPERHCCPRWNRVIRETLKDVQQVNDKLERCRFEYVNACKILANRTPDTRKKDIEDAYAVVRALNPIFGEEGF